jgi:hypothetical protein
LPFKCNLQRYIEPPKPKTKHKIDIDTAEKYEELRQQEEKYFKDMVGLCTLNQVDP